MAGVTTPAAFAQSASDTNPLPAVTVTGSRPALYRNADVNAGALGSVDSQQLPHATQSYSAELLRNQGARTLQDVTRNDPGAQSASFGGGFDNVILRGFSPNKTTALRRDGLLTNTYADLPLEAVERVDVLKGLTGFLYGIGEPGGIVNYVVKRPTAESLRSVTIGLGTNAGRYLHLDAGGPIDEDRRFGYRLNAAGERSGRHGNANELSRSMLSAAIDARVGPDTILRADVDHARKRVPAQPMLPATTGRRVIDASSLDANRIVAPDWADYRSAATNAGLRLEHRFSERWSLTAQYGISRTTRDAAFLSIGSIDDTGRIGSADFDWSPSQSYRTRHAQLVVQGRIDTGPVAHDIVAGYSDARFRGREGGFASYPGVMTGTLNDPVFSPRPDLDTVPQKNLNQSTQSGFFFSDTLSFGRDWRVQVGARQNRLRSSITRPDGSVRPYDAEVVVPTFALMWLPTSALTAYASYSQGIEQGAYAPAIAANRFERMDPIRSRQIEIGAKWKPRDSLQVQLALFQIRKPLQSIDPLDNVFRTLGEARHRGIELSMSGEVSRDLAIVGGIGWLDARIENTGSSRDGQRAPGVAALQASLWADWAMPAWRPLRLQAGAVHTGKRKLDAANQIYVPGYTRIDLGARYPGTVLGLPVDWRLAIENATNRRYWANVNYAGVMAGRSRTAWLSAEVQF